VILVSNFNKVLVSDQAGMSKICCELGLVDLMQTRHAGDNFATYSRGMTRIDYVLATPSVAAAMTSSGYDPSTFTSLVITKAFTLI
jgi:hypothetical protein